MAKKRLKLSKKNRNTVSGMLVGSASLYAIIVYMEISREELRGFLMSTLLLFGMILVLAILCIASIKFVSKLKQKIIKKIEVADQTSNQASDQNKDKE